MKPPSKREILRTPIEDRFDRVGVYAPRFAEVFSPPPLTVHVALRPLAQPLISYTYDREKNIFQIGGWTVIAVGITRSHSEPGS